MISLYMVLELKLYQKIDDIFLICLYQIYNHIRSLFGDDACFIKSCMYYTLLYFVFLFTESPYTASNQRGMYPSRQQAWHPLPEPGHSCKLKDA